MRRDPAWTTLRLTQARIRRRSVAVVLPAGARRFAVTSSAAPIDGVAVLRIP